jgi:hypothetical protein
VPEERLVTGWGLTIEIDGIPGLNVRSFQPSNQQNQGQDYSYYSGTNNGQTEHKGVASTQKPPLGPITIVGPVPEDNGAALEDWKEACSTPAGAEENKKTVLVTVYNGDKPVHTYNYTECICEDVTYPGLEAGQSNAYEYTLIVNPTTLTLERG